MKFKSLTSFFSGDSEETTTEETTTTETTTETPSEETAEVETPEETSEEVETETTASTETSEVINWEERYAEVNSRLAAVTSELNEFGDTTEARTEFRRVAKTNAIFVENMRAIGITPKADTTSLGGVKSYEVAPWNKEANELREKQEN